MVMLSLEGANRLYAASFVVLVVGASCTTLATVSLLYVSGIRDRYAETEMSRARAAAQSGPKAAEGHPAVVRDDAPISGGSAVWRSLTPEQEADLLRELQQLNGRIERVDFFRARMDQETDRFLDQMAGLVVRAGMTAGYAAADPSLLLMPQLSIVLKDERRPDLLDAFKKAGIEVRHLEGVPLATDFDAIVVGERDLAAH